MVRSTRRIRIVGSGGNVRLRASGDWESEPLKGLREASRLATAVDKLVGQEVALARRAGHSWTEVGEALGVTRQAAWERFSGNAG